MLRLSDAGDGWGGAAACSEVSRERLSELARERLPEPAEAEDRDPAPAVEPSARMLFELSEARRPVSFQPVRTFWFRFGPRRRLKFARLVV